MLTELNFMAKIIPDKAIANVTDETQYLAANEFDLLYMILISHYGCRMPTGTMEAAYKADNGYFKTFRGSFMGESVIIELYCKGPGLTRV